MDSRFNHTDMDFKNIIIKRLYIKCTVLISLVIYVAIMIIFGIRGELWAIVGYLGILVDLAYTIHFTSKNPFPFSVSSQDYEAILTLLSNSDKMKCIQYTEALYTLSPILDRLLYENKQTDEYYHKNLSLLQALLHHKKSVLSKEKDIFAAKCKELLYAYQEKSEKLPFDYGDINLINVEKKKWFSYMTSLFPGNIVTGIIIAILGAYFIYKIIITLLSIKNPEFLEENYLHYFIYNVGADLIATVTFVIDYIRSRNHNSGNS